MVDVIGTVLLSEAEVTARVEGLARAVELYRGPLLPGYYEDWILPERDRLFAGKPDDAPPTSVGFHLAALEQAGFKEAGTIWQIFDSFVVAGRR